MEVEQLDLENQANEDYVDRKVGAVLAKQFMSIDPANGQFMIPFRKVAGVQQYMRLSLTCLDGVWVPDLDQKAYIKNTDDTFTEVQDA